MFILRVHSVDTEHPLVVEEAAFSAISTNAAQSNPNPIYAERRGVVHLYRHASQSYLPNPTSRSTSLFVVAVPNYLSADDFIRFCESHVDNVHALLFLRNDAMEDRYSVLIRLNDQLTADAFYGIFNGKRFSPAEAEVCHILFVLSVDYTEVAEIARIPPEGFTELPTCPICLERLDPDTSGILSTLCDHSFQCSCTSKWTYLSCQVCRLCQQQDDVPSCSVCGTLENLWVCLICGFLGCGRYKEQHAIRHWKDTQHCYSLDLSTQQIWDYVGDNYVHRLNQSKTDGKLVDVNSRCSSLEENCDTCGCSEDSGISGALFSSKVETIVDEYNRLLATQLEAQRQVNRNLIKNQETWRKKVKEVEERETSLLCSRNEKILDLEEQIRDLTVFIEAQKTLDKMTDTNDIRGGTLLPVPSKQPNSRRNSKSGRKRS